MSLNFKYIDNKNVTSERFIKNKLLVDKVIAEREKIKHQGMISNMRGEKLDLSVVVPVPVPLYYDVPLYDPVSVPVTKESIPDFIESNDDMNPYPYYLLLDNFVSVYNVDEDDVFIHSKIEYRYFCYRYLNYMRSIELPFVCKNSHKEAVIIEYRKFPHLEFIIRNTIHKLGESWSHTVVCGNLNYEFMKQMCEGISENINVIKTNYDNLIVTEYSRLLSSLSFWNLFQGEKILIYQEDSCIFKTNMDDFMQYDYIGAPWPKTQNDNKNQVGNGGFSLRTRQCMKDVIEKKSIFESEYDATTMERMKQNERYVPPEDVYFSKNMLDYKIGVVADWDTASLFSTETINNPYSLGGHNFWLNDKDWKKRLYRDVVVQVKPNYEDFIVHIEHRGGWKTVLQELIHADFYNKNAKTKIEFFDIVDFNVNKIKHNRHMKWAGIFHLTPKTPPHLDSLNIQTFFQDQKFILSLNNCVFLISFSKYLTDFINKKIEESGIEKKPRVYTLKHPIKTNDVPCFHWDSYKKNTEKKLIQIGQQLRKITSIYTVKVPSLFQRMWLTGIKNMERCKDMLEREAQALGIMNMDTNRVKMYYTESFEEYDDLLSKNIVFVELYDAAANNTVLECIVRNTPIIINKVGGVPEYLGDDYPLYFTDPNQIHLLLTDEKLKEGHEYLKRRNKEDIRMDTFKRNLFSILQTMY